MKKLEISTDQKLSYIVDNLVEEHLKGVTLKTIEHSLLNKNAPRVVVDKVVRLVELKTKELAAAATVLDDFMFESYKMGLSPSEAKKAALRHKKQLRSKIKGIANEL